MMAKIIASLVFLLIIKSSICQTYRAAVVEHYPISDNNFENMILRNIDEYVQHISNADTQDPRPDIIVFPEYGLTGISNISQNLEEISTFLPNLTAIPCNVDAGEAGVVLSKALVDISCGIAQLSINVVINLIEKELNNINGTNYYSTTVFFNRDGAIVARYRKINLNADEWYLTPGNEVLTFVPDINLTFGIIAGDDILFQNPTQNILANAVVTDIIYTTRWNSSTPFQAALSFQAGFARSARVNLLASSLNDGINGLSGSGIYEYDGSSATTHISPVGGSRLIFRDLTRHSFREWPVCEEVVIGGRSLGGIIGGVPDASTIILPSENLQNYTSTIINLSSSGNVISENVCSGSYCCNFNITTAENQAFSSNDYVYRLIAFNGSILHGNVTIGTRACALVACLSNDVSTCGQRNPTFTANTTFTSISITGNFSNTTFTFDQPISLQTSLQPLYSSNYSFCVQTAQDRNTVRVSLDTKHDLNGLLTFGIFGRVYENDNQPIGPSSSASVQASLIMVIFVSFGVIFRNRA